MLIEYHEEIRKCGPLHTQWFHLVFGVSGESAQLAELQLDGGHLGDSAIGGPVWWMSHTSTDVHVRVRDL